MIDDLDSDILHGFGGNADSHSFIRIIQSETDRENDDISEFEQEPCIIKHSSYHDFDKLVSVLKSHKNKFCVFSQNIQSIGAKWNELQIFIQRLKNQGLFFSAICLQETWLDDNANIKDYDLDDYEPISQGKHCTNAGGLLIYLHKKLKHTVKKQLKYDTWEGLFIQVKKGEHLSKPVILGNIYRKTLYLNEHYTQF